MKIELLSFFDEIDFGFEINFIKEFHRCLLYTSEKTAL